VKRFDTDQLLLVILLTAVILALLVYRLFFS